MKVVISTIKADKRCIDLATNPFWHITLLIYHIPTYTYRRTIFQMSIFGQKNSNSSYFLVSSIISANMPCIIPTSKKKKKKEFFFRWAAQDTMPH